MLAFIFCVCMSCNMLGGYFTFSKMFFQGITNQLENGQNFLDWRQCTLIEICGALFIDICSDIIFPFLKTLAEYQITQTATTSHNKKGKRRKYVVVALASSTFTHLARKNKKVEYLSHSCLHTLFVSRIRTYRVCFKCKGRGFKFFLIFLAINKYVSCIYICMLCVM